MHMETARTIDTSIDVEWRILKPRYERKGGRGEDS